jgi:psiF repeat
MKQLLSVLAVGIALSAGMAQAQEKAKSPQQNKMALCNKEATGKTGDERKGFMKTCLSAGKTDVQQSKMKSCNAEASGKKGAERKAFMGECLKKA